MNRFTMLSVAAGLSLVTTGPAPASSKPCRDKSGRVIECPKVRKESPRCKDAKGRFAACPAGADGKGGRTTGQGKTN